jgi:hypothetical protein
VLPLPAATSLGATPGAPPRGATQFGIVASGTTPNAVNLVWSAVPNAATYEVLISEGVSVYSVLQGGLVDTRLMATNLRPSRQYRFVVRALDASGAEVGQSNTLNVTTGVAQATPTPTPSVTPRPSPTVEGQG